MSEIDWRAELEAIAPVTDEERLQDRIQRTRERIAGELRAGQLIFPGWPPPLIGAIEDPRDDAHDAMLYGLWGLTSALPRAAAPPAPPRLPWWRRWLLRLLGGQP
jgi:hypothetical protein